MDRLEGMTILLAAVDGGSLSAASRQLGLPLATVSRRVSELEEHLNIRLLLRGPRKVTLTDAGRAYVASCRRILEDIAEAERTAAGEYLSPRGELTVSAPQVMGSIHLMPVVAEFLRAYPDVRVHVQLSDRRVNLLEEDVDVAIRAGELPDSSLITVRVGWFRGVICASPAYLSIRDTPKKPADLASHDCVAYEGMGAWTAGTDWEFGPEGERETVSVPCRLVVNSAEAAISAAIAGAGIVRALPYLVDGPVKAGLLVTLLKAYERRPIPISLIYPSQRQVPLKLRTFLDFSIPRLRERLGG
ncbi:LysR substrate-binding domain-containing protein [Rhizobium pisi]|uniref:LysR substrate-binding domain-containing protein n=1 Tax=Rhizobium pisi TaxID=574561 RepID=UPI0039AF2F49